MLKLDKLLLVFMFCSFSLQSTAANVEYRAAVIAGSYDNVNLETNPTEKETSTSLYAAVNILEDNANLYTNLNTSVITTNYRNNITSDQTFLNLSANVVWKIKPGQFEWYLDNTFTQTVIDPLVSDAPTNRQNINVFSTGPNYTARINSRNNLLFQMRLENYSYQQNIDNNRAFISGGWNHNVNERLTLSIVNESEFTRFNDDVINADFDRNDLFFKADYKRGLNTFNAEYGYTYIDSEKTNSINDDRYLFAFSNARTKTSSIRLLYEKVLTDTGRVVASNNIPSSIDDPTNTSAANDVFLDESLRFQILNTLTDGNITFEISALDRKYAIQNNLDEIRKVALLNGYWNFKRSRRFGYSFIYANVEFVDPATDRIDDDYVYSLNYSHSIMRNYVIKFEVISQERISTAEDRSYKDLRFFLSFNYISL